MIEIQVFDHGYVKIDPEKWILGSDEFIVESARMSTGKGFLGWSDMRCECTFVDKIYDSLRLPLHNCDKCKGKGIIPGDEKLLRTLFMSDPMHSSPFEMCELVFEIQAPIFVFREWHRHRTQSYNEMSARYIKLPDLYYVPPIKRLMAAKQSSVNKQGSEEGFDSDTAINIAAMLNKTYKEARDMYCKLLAIGVSREIARLPIPVAQYSRMRAKANLLNWFRFITLRNHPKAQWEIQQYAAVIEQVIQRYFPRTHELFVEKGHRL